MQHLNNSHICIQKIAATANDDDDDGDDPPKINIPNKLSNDYLHPGHVHFGVNI